MTARDDFNAEKPDEMSEASWNQIGDEIFAAHEAEVLRSAAAWLVKKYGVTNRAASDLVRKAELIAQQGH